MFIFIDTETKSRINIKKAGTIRYTEDCRPLSYHWASLKSARPVRWESHLAPPDARPPLPPAQDPAHTFVAHNAMFDRHVVSQDFPELADPARWLCTAALARYYSLPGSLHAAGARLDLPPGLMKMDDSGGIQHFCLMDIPKFREPADDPERWAQFMAYGDQDTLACRAVFEELLKRLPASAYQHWLTHERLVYLLDQRVNDQGFAVDGEVLHSAMRMIDQAKPLLDAQMEHLTDGEVRKVQSPTLLSYLRSEFLLQVDNLRKETVAELLGVDDLAPRARQILTLRQSGARNSLAKYRAMDNMVSADGRIRAGYLYHGAHTGRWAGQGCQPQNLTRPIDELEPGLVAARVRDCQGSLVELVHAFPEYRHRLFDVLMSGVRGAVVAPKGKRLVVADYNQIESRITAYLSACQIKLTAFVEHDLGLSDLDPYEVTAELVLGDSRRRQEGKILDLGLGFGMGAERHAAVTGLDKDTAEEQVRAWRQTYGEIPGLWDCATRVVQEALGREYSPWATSTNHTAYLQEVLGIRATVDEHGVVMVTLPNGKPLFYHGMRHATWGECLRKAAKAGRLKAAQARFRRAMNRPFQALDGPLVNRDQLVYRTTHGYWQMVHGGSLTENWVQAVAREAMAEHMLEVERTTGYVPVLHSHDEPVYEVAADEAENFGDYLIRVMETTPPSLPGLPLRAAVGIHEAYTK